MHITVICTTCQKRYKVEAKLGGKKLKCKACGAVIAVPMLEAPAAAGGDDLMAGLAAAAAAEQKAPAGKPVRSVTSQSPAARAGVVKKPAPAAVEAEGGGGEMDFADMPCPRCGKPFSPSTRFCAPCGYDRNPPPPSVMAPAAAAGARRAPVKRVDDEERDYRGVRVNKEYANPILEFLDTYTPKAAVWLIVAAIAGFILLVWNGAMHSMAAQLGMLSYGRLIGWTFGVCIFFSLSMFINLAITGKGVELGGKVMKCQLPENIWSRLLATYLIPGFLAVIVLFVMGVGAAMLGSAGREVTAATAIVAVLCALATFLVASFFTFMFFFRLKILEALVCYLFFVIFYVVSCFVNWGVFFLIGLVLNLIVKSGKGSTF